MPESDSLPTETFIPNFIVLGLTVIVASFALYCANRKGRIQWRRRKSSMTVAQNFKQILANDFPASPTHTTKTMSLSEVVYNIPLNQPWPPAAETTRLPPVLKRSKSFAGNTVGDVFARGWKYVSSSISQRSSGEWRQCDISFGPRLNKDGTADIEWQPPTSWNVVGDQARKKNTCVPALLLPLPVIINPSWRNGQVDPSAFPIPR